MRREEMPAGARELFPCLATDRSSALLEEVEAALSGDDLHRAEELLKTGLRDDPFNAKLHGGLGRVSWRQGRMEDALNHLLRALELDPDDREAVMACVEVMRAFGKADDAVLVTQSYLKRYPDDQDFQELLGRLQPSADGRSKHFHESPADFLNERGELSFERGRWDHAAACFEMALEEDPSHAIAHSNLGIVRWHCGDVEGSLQCLYKALDLMPNDPDILHNCIHVLQSVGEIHLAKDLMRFYLQSGHGDTSDWETFENLIAAKEPFRWSHTGLSEKARDVYAETAKALVLAGDIVGALQAFDRATVIGPQTATAYVDFARLLQEAGAEDETTSLLDEALRKFPSNPELQRAQTELLPKRRSGETPQQSQHSENPNPHGTAGGHATSAEQPGCSHP